MKSFPAALRIANSVATLQGGSDDSLAALDTSQYSDGALVFVRETKALYGLNKSSAASTNPYVIAPISGPGRWFANGVGATYFTDVQVDRPGLNAGTSADSHFFLLGITSSDDIVVYNCKDSSLPNGVVTGPVRVTGLGQAVMRFTNASGSSISGATVAFRMAVLDG